MFPWKVLLGVVAGTVLVKEWKRADQLYNFIRAKLRVAVRKHNHNKLDERNNDELEPER